MKKIILTNIFIFAMVGCANKVDSLISKSKNSCTLDYLKVALVPDTNAILFNGLLGGSGGSGSSGATPITTNPVTITKDTTKTLTFSAPQAISSLNASGSTITGSVTNASDLHVFTFKGSSTLESWFIKLNTTSSVVCKVGQLALVSSIDLSNFSNLSKTVTTNEISLEASSIANTYIACVSTNSSLIANNTSATTPTFPISYSINLRKDNTATSATSNLTSTLIEQQSIAYQAKQLKASIDFVNCLNSVDTMAEIKKWMLF